VFTKHDLSRDKKSQQTPLNKSMRENFNWNKFINMKTSKVFLSASVFALCIAGLVSLSSCSGSGGGDVPPHVASLLKSGQWKLKTVKVDNADQMSLFTGLAITFSSSSYSATNGAPVWPASGGWTLNAEGTVISRSDGLQININNITETSLDLSLVWEKDTFGGRVGSVSGNHVFTLGK
jgi:hypothetical protein